MSSDIAISVEGLSKCYLVGHNAKQEEHPTLRDQIARHARNLARKTADMARGRAIVQGDTVEEFWALRDVSFEIPRGARVGILGRNGAGKSTLLKLLSRITEPTSGRIKINGRVASLLEVGTGFHPELTGRENIFLNGAILGMSRREIQSKFDEIVDFAEVDRFLDTPVKRYSSGMYVRLAFAVAAHLEPEILIVDEVLAVGDAQFQRKCLGKMKNVGSDGRTVIFVSHNIGAISQLCDTGIILRHGQLIGKGPVEEAISDYISLGDTVASGLREWKTGIGIDALLKRAEIVDAKGERRTEFNIDEAIEVRLQIDVERETPGARTGFRIVCGDGMVAFTSEDVDSLTSGIASRRGRHLISAKIPAGLLNEGTYSITAAAHLPNVRWLFLEDFVLQFRVHSTETAGAKRPGVVRPVIRWDDKLCGIPVQGEMAAHHPATISVP